MFYTGIIPIQNLNRQEVTVYFTSPTIAEALRTLHLEQGPLCLHMDGTFGVVPRAGGAYQLFIIHIMYEGHVSTKVTMCVLNFQSIYNSNNAVFQVYPIIYCLMQYRTTVSYTALFRILRETILGGEIQIGTVMTDYEKPLRRAIEESFPEASMKGCWFHYAKAVYMKGKLTIFYL